MADSGVVQWGLDGIVAVVIAVGGGIVRAIRSDHKDLEAKHDRLVDEIPRTFARRDDVAEAYRQLRESNKELNDKLDRLIERR